MSAIGQLTCRSGMLPDASPRVLNRVLNRAPLCVDLGAGVWPPPRVQDLEGSCCRPGCEAMQQASRTFICCCTAIWEDELQAGHVLMQQDGVNMEQPT
ncbi:unnamed protein product [Merluccius merluccius]